MKESCQSLDEGEIRSSPPQSSHIADHARGANTEASNVLCHGMWVRAVVQVLWSSADMPRRVQTSFVTSEAWSRVKHCLRWR